MAVIDRDKLNRVLAGLGYESMVLYEGLDEALIGFGTRFNAPVAIYNYDVCIQKIERETQGGCEKEAHDECDHWIEAQEYMDHNVTGAHVGDNTPIFVRFTPDIIDELAGDL